VSPRAEICRLRAPEALRAAPAADDERAAIHRHEGAGHEARFRAGQPENNGPLVSKLDECLKSPLPRSAGQNGSERLVETVHQRPHALAAEALRAVPPDFRVDVQPFPRVFVAGVSCSDDAQKRPEASRAQALWRRNGSGR
jgi:hypothetical protein